jgi:hypothetical protein
LTICVCALDYESSILWLGATRSGAKGGQGMQAAGGLAFFPIQLALATPSRRADA